MLVILSSSTACNLRCQYCSTPQSGERKDLRLSDCELLIKKLPALLNEKESITWLWHGGEPTILEAEHFSRLQSALDKIADKGFATRCTMQTNGYAINSSWLEALLRHNVQIGLSMDGPKHLHDSARLTVGGKASYEKILANFNKMREHGLSVSLLCTLRQEHLGHEEELFAWIEKMGVPIRLNPLLNLGRSLRGLSSADYFAFLKRLYAISLQKASIIPLQPLQSMLEASLGIREISECSYSGRCGERIFSYGPGGVVGPCNRSRLVYGNLMESSLLELWNGDSWRRRRNRLSDMAMGKCYQCSAWTKCHGGCPEIQDTQPSENDCEARRDFFAWLETSGLDILREALLQRRNIIREKLDLLTIAKANLKNRFPGNACHV